MKESISRFLLGVEAIVLLLPLSSLYGLLFAVLVSEGVYSRLVRDADVLLGLLLAGAGLFALWRLLGTAVIFGIADLRKVHRAWMAFCLLIGVWVLVACLAQFWLWQLGEGLGVHPGLRGVLLGLYGVPALVPLVHLAVELRWRKGGAA